ncbi:MAG: DUF262 domain-containing protein [Oscillospiraceae bacterium]|nr:DUF262 domain-containing protein [Oscillospiraceae bacterium]
MPIKSNLEKHTVSWLKRQDADGMLNKNISIQRKEIWDHEKKSNLIISILLDIPIESLLFEEADGGKFNVLDGKQRTTTLCSFIDNGFALSSRIRVKEINGFSLVGKKYKALPEQMKSHIQEYELSIAILRALEKEERATVFFMRNQALSLTKMDLSLVVLGEKAMNVFAKFCDHPFITGKIKLTEPAKRKREDLQIILQYMLLTQRPESGFSGKEIMRFCDEVQKGEAFINEGEIMKVLDFLNEVFAEKKQYLKRVHIPVLMYTAKTALSQNFTAYDFRKLIEGFFASLPTNEEYMTACKAGSAKRVNVRVRQKCMERILENE